MRKLLLASAAVAIMCSPAMASDSDSVTIEAFLAQACLVDIPGTLVSLPVNGDPSTAEAFTYECNFAGATPAVLTFTSTYGGVSSDLGVTDHVYNITPTTGPAGTSVAPLANPVAIVTANVAQGGSFTVDLVSPILIAGTYTDTLTIGIAP